MSPGASWWTEAATALLIAATLCTPLTPPLILLPVFGIVLYGAVTDHSNQTIGVLTSVANAALIVPLIDAEYGGQAAWAWQHVSDSL